MNISFYCINFNDDKRKNKMMKRFENQKLVLNFVPPVYTNDKRLDTDFINSKVCKAGKRIWSIMLQHLDSIQHFLDNTQNEYLIVCEDDIKISKTFVNDLHIALYQYVDLKLDVLLLGYLLDRKLGENEGEFRSLGKIGNFTFCDFPYHLWGSQMYLMNRKHAKFLLEKYTIDYAMADLNRPYNPDWTLTKDGKKALIYPMIALEEGDTKTDDEGQNSFHARCYMVNNSSNYE